MTFFINDYKLFIAKNAKKNNVPPDNWKRVSKIKHTNGWVRTFKHKDGYIIEILEDIYSDEFISSLKWIRTENKNSLLNAFSLNTKITDENLNKLSDIGEDLDSKKKNKRKLKMSMADNCEETFDCTGKSLKISEHSFLCKQNNIAKENLKECSTSFYQNDDISATIYYFENQINGDNFSFYSFDDGSWGYISD